MKNDKQFVIYPHSGEENYTNNLTPADKLIYLTIRKYMDKYSMEAYPSYAKITQDTGAAAKTIKKCIDNLTKEEYIKTRRDRRKIIYTFNNQKQFEPFSYDFLDKPDLTFTEKSYIVASQQYIFKDSKSEEGKFLLKIKNYLNLLKCQKLQYPDVIIL